MWVNVLPYLGLQVCLLNEKQESIGLWDFWIDFWTRTNFGRRWLGTTIFLCMTPIVLCLVWLDSWLWFLHLFDLIALLKFRDSRRRALTWARNFVLTRQSPGGRCLAPITNLQRHRFVVLAQQKRLIKKRTIESRYVSAIANDIEDEKQKIEHDMGWNGRQLSWQPLVGNDRNTKRERGKKPTSRWQRREIRLFRERVRDFRGLWQQEACVTLEAHLLSKGLASTVLTFLFKQQFT